MYSEEQKRCALELYGKTKSLTKTVRMLGYPNISTLRSWAQEAGIHEQCFEVTGRQTYSEETKRRALFLAYEVGMPVTRVAKQLGITSHTTISWWHRQKLEGSPPAKLAPTPVADPDPDPDPGSQPPESPPVSVEELQAKVKELQLENDVLRGVVDVLKAQSAPGRLAKLSNREKATIINSLRGAHPLNELIASLRISRSSYSYACKPSKFERRYEKARAAVVEVFNRLDGRRGYRAITQLLRQRDEPIRIGEKAVRQIMREEGLVVPYAGKRRRAYNSYRGEISLAPPNIVQRNFHAAAPNELWLTDITEFKLSECKCYLSPVIDCFDGLVVSWSVSTSPDARLVNSMLKKAVARLEPGERPVLHSDRGVHYRWPDWIDICNESGLIRSMSAKGCSPDNAACEGFFGRLKNEFFYYRDWRGVGFEEFKEQLDAYIEYYNATRIKQSLDWKSPLQYRRSLQLL